MPAGLLYLLLIRSRGVSQTSEMELFAKIVNYFLKKRSSQIFHWVLNKSLNRPKYPNSCAFVEFR